MARADSIKRAVWLPYWPDHQAAIGPDRILKLAQHLNPFPLRSEIKKEADAELLDSITSPREKHGYMQITRWLGFLDSFFSARNERIT